MQVLCPAHKIFLDTTTSIFLLIGDQLYNNDNNVNKKMSKLDICTCTIASLINQDAQFLDILIS